VIEVIERNDDDHMLLNAPYAVRAPVSVDEFLQLVLPLSEKMLKSRTRTSADFLCCGTSSVSRVCLSLTAFQQSIDLKAGMGDFKVRGSSFRPRRSGCCCATASLQRCARHRNQLQRRSRTRSFSCPRSRHKVQAPLQRPISLPRSVQ
jgi:hypothetical protein